MADRSTRTSYDLSYRHPNYYNYKRWMFAPYVRVLIKKFNIGKSSRVLDLGCGTGFFSQLFCEEEVNVVGIDLSEVGVRAAKTQRKGKIDWVIGDGNQLPFKLEGFDLIFCRGFVPYNLKEFRTRTELTQYLLQYLREKGIFIFACSTDLSGLASGRRRLVGKANSSWINQTLNDIEQHFSHIDSARLLDLYFLNRLELVCFGQHGLNPLINRINAFLVKATGIRGEAICVLEKHSQNG